MVAQLRYNGADTLTLCLSRLHLIGTVAYTWEPTPSYMWSHMHSAIPSGDPVVQMLDNSVFDLSDRSSHALLGFSKFEYSGRGSSKLEGLKPINSKFRSNSDGHRYGNLFTNLTILHADEKLSKARFKRDNEVDHPNIRGTVYPTLDYNIKDEWYDTVFLSWGVVLPGIASSPLGPAGSARAHTYMSYSLPLGPDTTDPLGGTSAGRSLFDDIIPHLEGFSWRGGNIPGTRLGLTRSVSDVEFHRGRDILDLRYTLSMEESAPGSWGNAVWDIRILARFVQISNDILEHGPSGNASPDNFKVQVEYYCALKEHKWHHDAVDYSQDPIEDSRTHMYDILLRSDCSRSVRVDEADLGLRLKRLTSNYAEFNRRDVENLRIAAFYSTADAIEGHLTTLNNNYLETLKELPEIASLIPDVGVLVKALIEFDKDPLAAGRDFADFFSSFLLKINFGWRPNSEALGELQKHGPDIWDSFKRFTSPDTKQLAGRFDYRLPDHHFWGPRFLRARSTLLMEYSDSSFATKILGLDSLGILPNLHRTWETLPYSFAIDWVTRLGRRLQDVDLAMQLFSCMTIHWAEHTFEVWSPLPSHTALSAVDYDRTDLELVWYRRELSRRIPPLVQGKYDFRQATTTPNFGILSSLIFQKAK